MPPRSPETKAKISVGVKKWLSLPENAAILKKHGFQKGHRVWSKGKQLSVEHRKGISESNKGRISPNKGKVFGHYVDGRGLKISQALMGKFCGENSPSWKGGISLEPYGLGFSHELRKRIRKRDGYRCQLCGLGREGGKRLVVHHIDYDKQNNDPSNLLTLCNPCHARTIGGNREEWTRRWSPFSGLATTQNYSGGQLEHDRD